MLINLLGGVCGRGAFVPFSFADRGNPWPYAVAEKPAPAMMLPDTGGIAAGLVAGTLVATDLGWQPVEDLVPGDRVVTFDNGLRPLRAVRVSTLFTAAEAAPRAVWPLSVPAGALGNRSALNLLPGQPLLIESDTAEAMYGDPFLMVTAAALEGYRGIAPAAPTPELTIVTLEFDTGEVVYVNGTLLAHCPAPDSDAAAGTRVLPAVPVPYQQLTAQQARRLVAAMHG